jgi:tRNA(Arg) A34 adenosine deaminase TadA
MSKDREYLLAAFVEAERSMKEGTFPIGAVIVNSNGVLKKRNYMKKWFERNSIFWFKKLEI